MTNITCKPLLAATLLHFAADTCEASQKSLSAASKGVRPAFVPRLGKRTSPQLSGYGLSFETINGNPNEEIYQQTGTESPLPLVVSARDYAGPSDKRLAAAQAPKRQQEQELENNLIDYFLQRLGNQQMQTSALADLSRNDYKRTLFTPRIG